jgi:hypothetical protein
VASRIEAAVARIGKDGPGGKRFRPFREFHFHDVIVFEDCALKHVAIDMPGIGIRHEQRVGLDGGSVSAKNRHLMVGEPHVLTVRSVNGYNVVSWRSGQISYWAASDLNASELEDFAKLFQSSPG